MLKQGSRLLFVLARSGGAQLRGGAPERGAPAGAGAVQLGRSARPDVCPPFILSIPITTHHHNNRHSHHHHHHNHGSY